MIITVGQLMAELEERDSQAFIEIEGLGQIVEIDVNDQGDVILRGEVKP